MQVHALDPESGRTFSGEAHGLDEDTINGFFNTFDVSEEALRKWIGRLPFSADAKAMLFKIASTTIRAGGLVIKIGRKILETVFALAKAHPMATIGLIIGAVLGSLVAAIPIIGFVIGPGVKALMMLIGAAWGAREDVRGDLDRKMRETMADFEALRTS